jgi:hypothetical protein
MNRACPPLGMLLALMLVLPEPASAQNRVIPAAIGAVVGTGAGGYVALGVTALRARRGRYLFGVQDALGWQSAAVLAGGGTGLVLGAWDENRLKNTVAATAALGLVGTGIGALVGHQRWPAPEGKWAGGVIGGAAGVLIGAAVGVLLPPDLIFGSKKESSAPIGASIRIPVGR